MRRTPVKRSLELGRVRDDPREAQPGDSHYTYDASGRQTPTTSGTLLTFDTLAALLKATTRDASRQASDVQNDYGGRSLGNAEKTAVWGIVEESDRHRREADGVEARKGVYTGAQDPQDAIGDGPDRSQAVGSSCKAGYREFVIEEDKVSTCVFDSLVEPNCYAGSRRAPEPDLGGADVCLYYPRDIFQPNGGCRQNYAEVNFRGRRTCRWDDLGPNQAAWYTLYKSDKPGSDTHQGLDCVEVGSVRPSDKDLYDYYCPPILGAIAPAFDYWVDITNRCDRTVHVVGDWSRYNGSVHSTHRVVYGPISRGQSVTVSTGCLTSNAPPSLLRTCAFPGFYNFGICRDF